jgi:hypothetical protein
MAKHLHLVEQPERISVVPRLVLTAAPPTAPEPGSDLLSRLRRRWGRGERLNYWTGSPGP